MSFPETVPPAPITSNPELAVEANSPHWITSKTARLIGTTLIAAVAVTGVSAETENINTNGGTTGTSASKGDCNYMPSPQHSAASTNTATAKDIGQKMVNKCFGASEWYSASDLWSKEASWDPMAINPGSGACGIPQSAPCNKLLNKFGKARLSATTVEEQLNWGINYIIDAYGTPYKALQHWKSRKPINGKDVGNWY
jgi:hypothetical protein